MTHEQTEHRNSTGVVSKTHVESGYVSSYPRNEAYREGMPRSTAEVLIKMTTLPYEGALIILYSLVEPVVDKSAFSSTSDKLKLLSSHKTVWTKLAQDLGILSSVVLIYTYNYLFNPSLFEMAKEVLEEKNQEVSIDVVEPNSNSTLLRQMKRKRKLVDSGSRATHITQPVNFNDIWR